MTREYIVRLKILAHANPYRDAITISCDTVRELCQMALERDKLKAERDSLNVEVADLLERHNLHLIAKERDELQAKLDYCLEHGHFTQRMLREMDNAGRETE